MIIDILVKTKQKISKVEKLNDGSYKVLVKALPTKNKANIEVIELIANHFNVLKSQVKIKGGKYSSRKQIYINEQMRLV